MATGKIARLPRAVREELNQRLENGEPGKRLVVWLNELPEVKALLAEDFGGGAVNEQNLTNWKQGGYRDWVAERQVAAWGGKAAEAVKAAGVTSEQLLTLSTVRYLVLAREFSQERRTNRDRCWRRWRVMVHDIVKLQQSEQRGERLKLDWARLKFSQEQWTDRQVAEKRRAVMKVLGVAKYCPAVGEAFASAMRRGRERAGEDGGWKMEDGSDCYAVRVGRGATDSTCRGVDQAGWESIKVNQGENILKIREGGAAKMENGGWRMDNLPCSSRAGARRSKGWATRRADGSTREIFNRAGRISTGGMARVRGKSVSCLPAHGLRWRHGGDPPIGGRGFLARSLIMPKVCFGD